MAGLLLVLFGGFKCFSRPFHSNTDLVVMKGNTSISGSNHSYVPARLCRKK